MSRFGFVVVIWVILGFSVFFFISFNLIFDCNRFSYKRISSEQPEKKSIKVNKMFAERKQRQKGWILKVIKINLKSMIPFNMKTTLFHFETNAFENANNRQFGREDTKCDNQTNTLTSIEKQSHSYSYWDYRTHV